MLFGLRSLAQNLSSLQSAVPRAEATIAPHDQPIKSGRAARWSPPVPPELLCVLCEWRGVKPGPVLSSASTRRSFVHVVKYF